MGLHPPYPLFQLTPFKLHYNLAFSGILVLAKIKYPRPLFFTDTILRLAPPPIFTPDFDPPFIKSWIRSKNCYYQLVHKRMSIFNL